MINFQELRQLANQTRSFIQMSPDKARALRVVIAKHDVVLGIFPWDGKRIGLHVIKGSRIRNGRAITPVRLSPFIIENRQLSSSRRRLPS